MATLTVDQRVAMDMAKPSVIVMPDGLGGYYFEIAFAVLPIPKFSSAVACRYYPTAEEALAAGRNFIRSYVRRN